MKQFSDAHLFALYVPTLPAVRVGGSFALTDVDMLHRISTVLRMQIGDELLFFNEGFFARVRIEVVTKKQLNCSVIEVGKQSPLEPILTLGLPLLKREALEEAVYAATELGVQKIALLITEKSRKQLHPHELERLNRIMVAACEQAKYFYLPWLNSPAQLLNFLTVERNFIFCDPTGEPFSMLMQNNEHTQNYTILIGPEGDLTHAEKELLKKNAQFIRLTPTILRVPQAVTVALGNLRSH